MTDKEIVERAKEAEKKTGFGELVHSPISKGVNSAFGIGFIEGMVEYRNSLQEESVRKVWHYQKKEPVDEIADKSRPIIVVYGNNSLNSAGKFRYYENNSDAIWLSNSYEKWAFVEDLINLTHSVTKVSWQEEPVSEELEKASKEWLKPQLDKSYADYGEVKMMELTRFDGYAMLDAIEFGVKWKIENLWKPADGDDLPEIDREVIAILDNGKVGFAHRPPEYWDGKDIVTGKVTRNYPKTYDKGGWNQPNVKWWLDCSLPNTEED